jgi:hypothetical protein
MSVRMELLVRQATMSWANTSMTKATYSQPCQVGTYAKSDRHSGTLTDVRKAADPTGQDRRAAARRLGHGRARRNRLGAVLLEQVMQSRPHPVRL